MIKKIVYLLLCVCFVGPCFGQSLKIMTYNIRLDLASDGENDWTHRLPFFTGQVLFYEPDVLGVQEATPSQVTDMSNSFPQYLYTGEGRDGIGKGEASGIYYKKDRLTLLQSKTFWLSETPDTISKGWDAALNRVCTYALFKDKHTKKKFWVFNTHLDHIGELARTNSIALILTKIAALNKKNDPVIFMGDFNTEPGAARLEQIRKVMDDSRLVSLEKPFGPAGTFNGFKHHEPVTKLIDYIFVSKGTAIIVKKYAVLSDSDRMRYPSDHLPVYAEITIKK